MHFDEVMETLIGHGLVQQFVIGCCFLMTVLHGFISTAIYYFLPHILCDLESSWHQLIYAFTPYIYGACFGSIWFGVTSDINGRRYSLEMASILFFISCILLATSSSTLFAGFSLFLLGLSSAGVHAGCRIITFEVLAPAFRRSRYLIIESFTIAGCVLASALAHFIRHYQPTTCVHIFVTWQIHWRTIIVIASILGMIGACQVSVLPSSPRQLFAHQRFVSATITLRRFLAVNKCTNEDAFIHFDVEPFRNTENRIYRRQHYADYFIFFTRCLWSYLAGIFCKSRAFSACSLLLISVVLFDGSAILISLLSERVTYSQRNCSFSGGRAVNLATWNQICELTSLNHYKSNFYIGIALLIPTAILPFLMVVFSRKILLALCCVSTGLGGLLLAHNSEPFWDLPLAAFTAVFHSTGIAALHLLTLEIFPTKFRGTAFGFMTLSAHVTCLAIMFFTETSCFSTLSIIASLFFVGGFAALFIPEPGDVVLEE